MSLSNASPEQPTQAQDRKVGKGIVHEGCIYGIRDDSLLAAALEKITDKKEQCKFILEHGKKGGKVDFDTRRQRMEEVAGLGTESSQ
jgi:hypothetical protein